MGPDRREAPRPARAVGSEPRGARHPPAPAANGRSATGGRTCTKTADGGEPRSVALASALRVRVQPGHAVGYLREIPRYGAAVVRRLRRRSASNFQLAFVFLGPAQRQALSHVYGFCRVVDDIVDDREDTPVGEATARAELDRWRAEVAAMFDGRSSALTTALGRRLAGVIVSYQLPREAFDAIIDGVSMDLDHRTYADLGMLEQYCYRVASCVGLLCLGIFGDQSPGARTYAHHLGLALQYTNILRDVGEDAARGRVYLPEDLLARYGLTPADILSGAGGTRFLDAADEFADIAQREYDQAWRAFDAVEHQRALLPAEVMGRTYHAILQKMRRRDYDVREQRTSLRRRDKLRVAAWTVARMNLLAAIGSAVPSRRL
ncbi:MAG: squalene synthase HpnD [Myxococcales bacterium FL481]|nr:MAG: squalene synthase HpnD [Myxococcales bacterium FL481]